MRAAAIAGLLLFLQDCGGRTSVPKFVSRGLRSPSTAQQRTIQQKSKFYAYDLASDGQLSIWRAELDKAMKDSPRRTIDPKEAAVFFLGIDYACEKDWPHYSAFPKNINYLKGDADSCYRTRDARLKKYIEEQATYLDLSRNSTYGAHVVVCMKGYTVVPPSHRSSSQPMIWAAPSFGAAHFRAGQDVSWPSMNVVNLNMKEAKCGNSKYKLVFKGTNDFPTRRKVAALNNDKDVIIKLQDFKGNCVHAEQEITRKDVLSEVGGQEKCGSGQYSELLANTDFGLVVRGDNLYSYRFLEVMSAGAIPVILSDCWVLPFYEIIDYSKFAIIIKEAEWDSVLSAIDALPAARICAMKREALRVYEKHFRSHAVQLEAFMEVVDARSSGSARIPPRDWRDCEQAGSNCRCE